MTDSTIIYTHTDEAPALATYSFLPVVQAYASQAGVTVETRDISLAGRIIAVLPGVPRPRTSASPTPWPSWASWPRRPRPTSSSCRTSRRPSRSSRPRSPSCRRRATRCRTTRTTRRPTRSATSAPATTRSRAAPSTRCCARATPTAAPPRRSRTTPRPTRTAWAPGPPSRRPTSRTMGADDFRSTEKSAVIAEAGSLRIELVGDDGTTTVLRESVPVLAGEVVDASVMRVARAARVPRPRRSPAPRPRACCSPCT